MTELELTDCDTQINQLKEKVHAFEALKRQLVLKLDFFNLLFETLASPVFIKDQNGVYTGCNKAFEALFGKKRDEIVGKTAHDLWPAHLADKYQEMDNTLFEQGGIQQYEDLVRDADGNERQVIFDKALYYNEDQCIGGLIGAVTDISYRTRAEAALKISQEKFKKISSMANDAIIQMNQDGRITFWNESAQKIFGYTWDEVEDKNLHSLLTPERYHLMFENGFERFKTSGGGQAIGKTLELTALKKDGTEFEIELSLSAYCEHGQWQSVGIVRDISERKKIEREKELLIKNLKTALDEIKTLKGIVPICSSCKKIRDDKGFWKHVETYIQEHSQAEFSHGICPDCSRKLYPDFHTDNEKQ